MCSLTQSPSPPIPEKCVVIDVASELRANSPVVWRRVASPAGVNFELWPLRMTFPLDVKTIDDAPIGRNLFRSVVSLFGVLPLDWHFFGLESVDPGRSFHEISSSLWMARWVHIRTVEPLVFRCIVRDHVEFVPRIGVLGPLVAPLYRFIFRRRHQRLRLQFGGHNIKAVE